MAQPSERTEQRALRRALGELQERLADRQRHQQEAHQALWGQLHAIEQQLNAAGPADSGQEIRSRLIQALGPHQELEAWCEQVYGPRLEASLAARPEQLVEVEFTLVRLADRAGAERLLSQLQAGEDLGAEGAAVGLVGPRLLQGLNATLREALEPLEPGGVQGPLPLGSWWVLLRLERRGMATLAGEVRRELLQDLLDQDLAAVSAGHAPLHAPELAALLVG